MWNVIPKFKALFAVAALSLLSACPGDEGNVTALGADSSATPIENTDPALQAQIVSGAEFYTDKGEIVKGSLPILAAFDLTTSFAGPAVVSSVTGLSPADVCNTKTLLGVSGTAVCLGGGGGGGTVATPAQILTGKTAYDASGVAINGTMPAYAFDMTAAFPGAGYYSGYSGQPSAAQVCAPAGSAVAGPTTFLGAAGTAICQGASGGTTAAAAQVLTGYNFWNASGTSVAGTMVDHGAYDFDSGAIPGTSAGYYSSISTTLTNASVCSNKNLFGSAGTAFCSTAGSLSASSMGGGNDNNDAITTYSATASAGNSYTSAAISMGVDFVKANICSGKTIFGRAGTAVCNSIFGDLTKSNLSRTKGTTQIALSGEKVSATYAAGIREVTNVLYDDDGYWTAANGCSYGSDCSPVGLASRPSTTCGSSGSLATRIADCASKNASAATWDGGDNGISGEAVWKLVSYISGSEVWQDQRTLLVWSDSVGGATWCQADGNNQSNDPSSICNNTSYQPASPVSYCTEAAGLNAPPGENWGTGTYSAAKGQMGKNSTDKVRWRLPTKNDFMQADLDGLRYVLPNFMNGTPFWSATTSSLDRSQALLYSLYNIGGFNTDWRGNYHYIRCVGTGTP